jgi:hypothetical protein
MSVSLSLKNRQQIGSKSVTLCHAIQCNARKGYQGLNPFSTTTLWCGGVTQCYPSKGRALIYASTGLDNSANILGPEVTRMVNEFTTKKCAKLKDDLPRSKGN